MKTDSPYTQGYTDGSSHLPEFLIRKADKQAREAYYLALSDDARGEYERGWYDAYANVKFPARKKMRLASAG